MSESPIHKMIHAWQNKLQKRIETAIDRKELPERFSFEWLLLVLSKVYGLGTGLRTWCYEKGVLKQNRLPCFVISIGNIVAGGTGKTPMAVYVADAVKKSGKTPVVISRGYRGSYKGDALVVSDGLRVFAEATVCGDEPYMMAQKKTFPVVVGKNRFLAGKRAIEQFSPDVIILDDGFQHLALQRDLDILLFDDRDPVGNGRLLPSGRLRERPDKAAGRAHCLIFTRCREKDAADTSFKRQETQGSSRQQVKEMFGHVPTFRTSHEPFVCETGAGKSRENKTKRDIGFLKGTQAVLFSGIAKNDAFYQTMTACGVNILEHLEFQDHYRYKKSDFDRINRLADKLDADFILTTHKDGTKLNPDTTWTKELVIVDIQIRFEAEAEFQSFIERKIKQK